MKHYIKNFSSACRDRTRCNGFKVKEGRFKLDLGSFIQLDGGTLEQVAQRDGECPRNIQGQAA